jgi:hypothetical protein
MIMTGTMKAVWLAIALAASPSLVVAETPSNEKPPGQQMQDKTGPGASSYAHDNKPGPPGQEMLDKSKDQPGASKYAPGHDDNPSSSPKK